MCHIFVIVFVESTDIDSISLSTRLQICFIGSNAARNACRVWTWFLVITVAENLYYSLYARVVIELANIELCATWPDSRVLQSRRAFLLPEADHLYRIVLAFKEVLDDPLVCPRLRMETALHFEQSYITQVVDSSESTDYSPQESLGYRLHVMTILADRDGPFCTKWKTLIPFFNVIPSRTMAMLSEKYLAVAPVTIIPDDVPFDQLPFIDPNKTNKADRDNDFTKDQRMMALAALEGTTIGEERHKDPQSRIYHLTKQGKCVCFGVCRCSKDCTRDVLHDCPCAERHVRIMTIKRGLYYKWPDCAFSTSAGTMTRMYFHGLAALKRSVPNRHITQELLRAFELMDALISSHRDKDKKNRKSHEKESAKEAA